MLRGGALVFLSRNFQKVVASLIVIVLGRTLDQSAVGTWGLMLATLTYVTTIGGMGLGPAQVHFRGQGRMQIRHVLANAAAGAGGFGLIAIAVVWLLRRTVGFELGDPLLLTVLSLAFPLALMAGYLDFLWQGEDRLGIYAALFCVRSITLLALVLIALQLPDPFVALAVALLLNSLITVGVSLFLVRREYGLAPTFKRGLFVDATSYGFHIQAGSVAQAIGYRFDYFLINAFLGASVTGAYVIATNLAEALWVLPFALSIALLPRVSTTDVTAAREVTARTCRVVFALSLLSGMALFVIADPLLRLLFGTKFLSSVTPLRILLIGTVMFSLQKILANYFIGQGQAKWFQRATLLSMAVNLGMNLWFLNATRLGITGAAIASAASYSLSTLILLALFVSEARVSPHDVLIPNGRDVAQLSARLRTLRGRAASLRTGRLAR